MKSHNLTGAMTCARYAFAPNFYMYCGPDTDGELGEYLKAELADGGLVEHLTRFEVLYPYLTAIAHANAKSDALDPKVVEAYWVGNKMLEKVTEQDVFLALTDHQNLPKRIPKSELKWLLPKIDQQARLHHSFHVFNVFTRTGHHSVQHTVETMDNCRISWGQLIRSKAKTQNSRVQLKSQMLVYKDGKLEFEPFVREATIPSDLLEERMKPDDYVSVHWGFVCDVLSKRQVQMLKKYTDYHLKLANQTI